MAISTSNSKKATEPTTKTVSKETKNILNKPTTLGVKCFGYTINIMHIVITGLLIINIIIGLLGLQSNNVEAIMEKSEAMKVGGKENYAKLKQIMQSESYKTNYAQNIDMMLMQMEKTTNNSKEESGNEAELFNDINASGEQPISSNPEMRGDE